MEQINKYKKQILKYKILSIESFNDYEMNAIRQYGGGRVPRKDAKWTTENLRVINDKLEQLCPEFANERKAIYAEMKLSFKDRERDLRAETREKKRAAAVVATLVAPPVATATNGPQNPNEVQEEDSEVAGNKKGVRR